MALIVGDVVNRALRMANRVDPKHRTRALDGVDRAVRYFGDRLPWPSLERTEEFLTNGTQFFTFPARVRQIIAIGDIGRQEYVRPGAQWERQHPTAILGGSRPTGLFEWQDRGWRPVIQAPSTDTTLLLQTTVSEALSVTVRGLLRDTTASGTPLELYEASEIVAANVTAVSSANTYVTVSAIEKNSVGDSSDVVVTYNRGTRSAAARLPGNERSAQYRSIEWLGTLGAGQSFHTRYYRMPPKIADEAQVLDPSIDEDVIFWGTVGDLHWMAESPQAAQAAWQQRDSRMQALLTAQQAHGDNLSQAIPYAPMIDCDPWEVSW